MTWLDGEGAVLSEGIEKSTREVENTRRVTAVSKIKFTASKEHHNTSLTCQVRGLPYMTSAVGGGGGVPKKQT